MTTLALDTVSITLPGNRALIVALVHDAEGSDQHVLIGAGFPDHGLLPMLAAGVSIPASALPELQHALATLTANHTSGPSTVSCS